MQIVDAQQNESLKKIGTILHQESVSVIAGVFVTMEQVATDLINAKKDKHDIQTSNSPGIRFVMDFIQDILDQSVFFAIASVVGLTKNRFQEDAIRLY